MAPNNSGASKSAKRTLVITRVLDAPPSLVFNAWIEPDAVGQWWGPKGFTTTYKKLDVRPGGSFRICMRSPEGKDHWAQGVYREIVEPERLVFTWAWENPKGNPGHETLVTVKLAKHGAKTKLTFRQAPFETDKDRNSHRGGWSEAFDRLAEYLTTTDTRDQHKTPAKEMDMLGDKEAIATVAVKNIEAARKFYEGKLGLERLPAHEAEVLVYRSGHSKLLVYESQYAGTNEATAVTWGVGEDVTRIAQALKAKGVTFEKYDMPNTTRDGDVHVSGSMRVAWFKDPDGNIHALINQ